MDFKISVIIPTFNREKYIETAIDSIINQTIGFENIELIIVDDASTDNTQSIIESYAKKYSNIKSEYLKENSGYAGKPRNIGINLASSEYLMFLDSDDYFEEDACEFLYNKMKNEEINIIIGTCNVHKNDKIISGTPEYFKNKNVLKFENLHENKEFLKFLELVAPKMSMIIFKKSFINEHHIRFNEEIPGQDTVFIVETLLNAKKILYLTDFVVYNYISHENSITTTRTKKYFEGLVKSEELVFNIFKKQNLEEYYKCHISRKLDFFLSQLLLSEIGDKKHLKEIFNILNGFFDRVNSYGVVPNNSIHQIAFNLVKQTDIVNLIYLKETNSKIRRLWNKNILIKEKNNRLKEQHNRLKEQRNMLKEQRSMLKEKVKNKNNIIERITREKAELQTVRGWFKFKISALTNKFR
ncbi:MAG: glycosyltransferase [Methanobrevibacter sp.]|nr:glycosyltransferase [Methanobrevibacter sp.]